MNTPEVKCAKGNEMNKLYQGDNLAILRSLPGFSRLDMHGFDPPFNG